MVDQNNRPRTVTTATWSTGVAGCFCLITVFEFIEIRVHCEATRQLDRWPINGSHNHREDDWIVARRFERSHCAL